MTYIVADYTSFEDSEPYDGVISSLSIHHFEDEAKQALYGRIFQLLKPGGVFVNADQVLGRLLSLIDYTVLIGMAKDRSHRSIS